jgi:CBS domain-containing protein
MTLPAADPQREMLTLVTARVRDAWLRQPVYVDGTTTIVAACRVLADAGATSALVRDGERLGIFTTTDLRDALLREVPPDVLPVREVARFSIVDIGADADLFEALATMVSHRVHRLVVRDANGAVLGLMAQLDLVSLIANHSNIVAVQIDEAKDLDDLAVAAHRLDAMVGLLHDGGVRIERVARMVGELNQRLFARLWSVVAPAEVRAATCLLVMGSEGRGEQILKTDQDNALLIDDGFEDLAAVEAAAQRFSDGLARFGWPRCPGDIMVTNPLWRCRVAAFRERLADWMLGSDPDGPMRLAIFVDAIAVAGDATLLAAAREHFERLAATSDAFEQRFAAAADQFDEPQTWWQRIAGRSDEQPLDLKKLGTFPIVHGARALSLRHRVRETGTVARLSALVAQEHLDAELGRDLTEALHYLMNLRLRMQLRQRARGGMPTNLVKPSEMSLMDRDQLKDALAIVRRFRGLLRQRFRLDAL